MLNKDSFSLGVVLGTLIPVLVFGILYLLNRLIERLVIEGAFIEWNKLVLVSIAVNLIVLRHYFVKLKFDRTGRGILLITFALVLLFFGLIENPS